MNTYRTKGVCAQAIQFDVKDTQGVARLVEGMDVDEAIKRMSGIRCGFKPTSCPDQLAKALSEYQQSH